MKLRLKELEDAKHDRQHEKHARKNELKLKEHAEREREREHELIQDRERRAREL